MKKTIITLLAASFTSTNLFAATFAERAEAVSSVTRSVEQIAALDLSCNVKADCVALAVGSRACGGVDGFVVASKKSPYYAIAESLAITSQSVEEIFNQLEDSFSICSIEMEPKVNCVRNKCLGSVPFPIEPLPAM